MKLLTFFVLLAMVSVAGNSYSQQTRFNLRLSGVTVQDVFREIENNSEFILLYNEKQLDANRIVDVKVENETVESVLNQIFEGTENSYKIYDRQIVILSPDTKELPSNIKTEVAVQQKTELSGTVIDAEGLPLPGVSVVIKGTRIAAITDANGKFSISLTPDAKVLLFSFIGMKTKEVQVGTQKEINLIMEPEISGLNEVMVIGYGSRAKKDVTTAISSMDNKAIEKVVTMNPVMAMQGQMSGVQVSGNSGNLMDKPTVRIRGTNTWGIADPLYVIDGIPVQEFGSGIDATTGLTSFLAGPINPMSMIDPNDIESISVLKDASAAAIYGVRAANGVILITTKKGKGDKPKVDFSMRYGIQNMTQHLDVLNTQQYTKHMQDLYATDPTYAVDIRNQGLYDPTDPRYLGNNPTYDWQNEMKNKNAAVQDYSIRLSGGTAKTDYFVSLGYTSQEGTFKGNNLDRYNASFKINSQVTKWFRTGVNYRISNIKGIDAGDYQDLNFSKLAQAPPWQPVRDPNGPYGYAPAISLPFNSDGSANPIYGTGTQWNYPAIFSICDWSMSALRNMGTAYVEIEPVTHLKLNAKVSFDANNRLNTLFDNSDESLFNYMYGDPVQYGNGHSAGNLEQHDISESNIIKELSLSYNNKFGDHSIDLILNAMDQRVESRALSTRTTQMVSADPNLRYFPSSSYTQCESYLDRSGLAGTMGRISYNYKSRYYLDMTVRRDGSTRFAPEYRWGVFPSFSAAWRISDEPFMKDIKWLSDLKIHAGWGKLGNQEVPTLQYLTTISNNPVTAFGTSADGRGNLINGATTYSIPTSNLTWEKTTTSNIGIDAIIAHNLSFSLEYYNKLTDGILQAMTIPLSVGVVNAPWENTASVRNSGIELSMNYTDQIGEVKYNLSGNFTTVKNMVEKTFNDIPLWNIEEGQSMFYIKGYKVGGIFQNQAEVDAWKAKYTDASYQTAKIAPGDVFFQDLRSAPTTSGSFYSNTPDGKIDSYDMVNLGNSIPKFYYGFNLNVEYKGIDLVAQFTGVGDVYRYNSVRAALEYSPATGTNLSTKVLNAWTSDNPTNVPRLIVGDPASNFRESNMFVEKAGYLRLSTLQLGYTLPKKVYELTQNSIRNARFYVSGSNLFTITPYTGLDPENDSYPMPRIFSMGLNVSF